MVKLGRELEYYLYYDSVLFVSYDKCFVIKIEFVGRFCILKVICIYIDGKDCFLIIIYSFWLR